MRRLVISLVLIVGCTSESPGVGAGGSSDGGTEVGSDGSAGPSAADAGGPGGHDPGGHDYGQDGPSTWMQLTMTVTRADNTTFPVVAWIPDAAGAHPVVMLSSGLMQTA